MPRIAHRILAFLQLTRLALVFTAISNIWLVILLSRLLGADHPGWVTHAVRTMSLPALLGTTAAIAAGLYVFGMTLNDVFDARRDRTFAPQRPLPSGRIGPGAAIGIAVTALLIALAGSVALGPQSTLLCIVCAGLILFYNGPAKHIPGVGVLTLGLIRGVHMLIANPALGFCWPVWLTLSHVIGMSAAGHRLEGKRPTLAGAHLWIVTCGWSFMTVALFGWMNYKGALAPLADLPWLWAGPVLVTGVFVGLAMRAVDRAPSERAGGEALVKLGLLWLIVYDAAWLLGGGDWAGALLITACLPAAWIAMTLTRRLAASTQRTEGFLRDDAAPHGPPRVSALDPHESSN